MLIKKVKLDGKDYRVLIKYVNSKGTHESKFDEDPTPEFKDAMDDLRDHLIEWIEITDGLSTSKVTIRGVSFSDSNGIMGACITGLISLTDSNSPLCINTPHKSEMPYSEGGDDSVCLTSRCTDALKKVMDQCKAYLDGKRAQQELFDATIIPGGKEAQDLLDSFSDDNEVKSSIQSITITSGDKKVELKGGP